MTEQEMWKCFLQQCPEAARKPYETWSYGDAADELAELTCSGIKTATASAYPLYELEGEPIPEAGAYSIILRSDGSAACVIRTEKVSVIPFREVSGTHAFREGEGDRTLPYWREVHKRFFQKELEAAGLCFTEDMGVVCEEFQVVFTL